MKPKQTVVALVIFITLIALILRLVPALTANFPLNDGGLFYSMIQDLQSNHFVLPAFTSYNHAQLPFAYPPLAFYVVGLISSLFQIDPLDLLRFLPPVVSAICIPLFYLLAKRVTSDPLQIIFAVLLFAFTPMAFEWQVMGGGITRSLGQAFAILTFILAYDFYSRPTRSAAIGLVSAGALVVSTHPEAAMQTAIGALIIAVVIGRSRRLIFPTLWIGLCVLILSAPWWGTVLTRFGLDPMLAAIGAARQDGGPFLTRLILLFQFNVTEEPFVTFAACLGLVGIFLAFARRDHFLPVWMLSALLIDPRGGTRFAMLPLALLGGLTLSVIWPLLNRNSDAGSGENLETALLGSRVKRLFFGYLFIALLIGAFVTMQNIQSRQTVTRAGLDAFAWIEQNTPRDSTLIAVTGARPLLDPFTEWLPALSERQVATSAFGYEWLNDGQFGARVQAYRDLQACISSNTDCVLNWMATNQAVDYLVVAPAASQPNGFPLQVWLTNSAHFKKIYENETITIYEVVK